mgnify:CR=1 FL=1
MVRNGEIKTRRVRRTATVAVECLGTVSVQGFRRLLKGYKSLVCMGLIVLLSHLGLNARPNFRVLEDNVFRPQAIRAKTDGAN